MSLMKVLRSAIISSAPSVYLLGRCEDRVEALRRRMVLLSRFHFDPAMIRIHPDNGGDKLLYGAKVLGSYVGSEESIANMLEKKLAELRKEADAITTVGSLQIQYLLLRWCFCQKIIHLQRTIPPNLIGTYLEPGFTELKKLIVNSILGRADGIPPKTFDLAELHIQYIYYIVYIIYSILCILCMLCNCY